MEIECDDSIRDRIILLASSNRAMYISFYIFTMNLSIYLLSPKIEYIYDQKKEKMKKQFCFFKT